MKPLPLHILLLAHFLLLPPAQPFRVTLLKMEDINVRAIHCLDRALSRVDTEGRGTIDSSYSDSA